MVLLLGFASGLPYLLTVHDALGLAGDGRHPARGHRHFRAGRHALRVQIPLVATD